MTEDQRERFDSLLQDAIDALPPRIRSLIDKVPVIVLDHPTPDMLEKLRSDGLLDAQDDGADLCGLHTGIGITERSIEDPEGWGPWGADGAGPEQIHLFRDGVIDLAGGWEAPEADENIYEEIRITLLHEIGHHFGLDEDDLENLGYA